MNTNLAVAGKKWGYPAEAFLAEAGVLLRRGASWRLQLPLLVILLSSAVILSAIVGDLIGWLNHRAAILLALVGIGSWRWSWFIVQTFRAIAYRYFVFPRLKRAAAQAVAEHGPVPEVAVLAVTYKEKPWITRAVFRSLFRELASLEGLQTPPKVVVATGCDKDDETIWEVFAESCASLTPTDQTNWPPCVVLLRDDTGKRPAIATALRRILADQPHPDGVVVFMDGDTMMQPGLMGKILPLFRLQPEVSAITTNENGWVSGPRWFAEWISLRFGLRHRTMCSIALSGKLLCLTGRFSAFRGSVASEPTFLAQIEKDSIEHWLWGSFDMLSGDDKSTWYWLAARAKRMLYVPDATVTTFEVVSDSALKRALANIRRWSGNSLRHSWRAFKLGPEKLGWFCWYSLLDQRLAIWTVLVGPTFALLALCAGHFQIAAGYVLWVMFSRLAHSAIAWQHGRRISFFYLPLQVVSDWVISLSKIWILFHPAKQAWLNRGARTLDSTRAAACRWRRAAIAHWLYACACVAAVVGIGLLSGFLPVLRESALLLGTSGKSDENYHSQPAITAPAELLEPTELFGQQPAVESRANSALTAANK